MESEVSYNNNETIIYWQGKIQPVGVIPCGQTATVTINVNIDPYLVGSLVLHYSIAVDNFETEPHIVNGTIMLTEIYSPISWLEVNLLEGVFFAWKNVCINCLFSTVNMVSCWSGFELITFTVSEGNSNWSDSVLFIVNFMNTPSRYLFAEKFSI